MSRLRRTYGPLLALAAAVLALGIAGCGDDDDEPAPSDTAPAAAEETPQGADNGGAGAQAQEVEMLDFEFSPPTVTIAAGGEVTWVNSGQAPHDATADENAFATDTIEPGDSGRVTIDEPGTYSYICTIHPQMQATIEVAG